jgi:hypothetical protein
VYLPGNWLKLAGLPTMNFKTLGGRLCVIEVQERVATRWVLPNLTNAKAFYSMLEYPK